MLQLTLILLASISTIAIFGWLIFIEKDIDEDEVLGLVLGLMLMSMALIPAVYILTPFIILGFIMLYKRN